MKEKINKIIFELNYRMNNGKPTSNKKFIKEFLTELFGVLSVSILLYLLFCLVCFI